MKSADETSIESKRQGSTVGDGAAMSDQKVPSNGHGQQGTTGHEDGAIPTDLPRPGVGKILLVLLLFVVLLGAMFVVGYLPHRATVEVAGADAAAMAGDVPVVSTTHPHPIATAQNLILPCNVKPLQETAIYAQATGYLRKLYVDIGSAVKEGQLLAEIDTPEVDAQLEQSKANLERAKAAVNTAQSNVDLAKHTLERFNDAEKETKGSISELDLDQKRAAYDQAVAALAQANADVNADAADVNRLTVLTGFEKVYAPFAGTITARNYDLGAYLSAANTTGKELFHITRSDTLRVFVSVPQTFVTAIKTGQDAYLTVANYPGRKFKGTVALAAGALDPATRTMQYELDFPNKEHELFAGMYGQAQLATTDVQPMLGIPTSALVFNAEGSQVVVIRDKKVHYQKISVGRDYGTELEALTGVTADDEVVANPGERLVEGLTVKAVPDKVEAVAKPATADARPGGKPGA
jgi:RND family efflux transporter MFP subunit